MRTQLLSVAVVALLGSTGAIANDTMSLNQFPHRLEPVLMQVDSHGKVTEASPAYSLPPKMARLLDANLGEMIHAPATDKHGKPIASQFVMNVVLQAKPDGAGNYDAHFTYVSTRPVPAGEWYWVHLDGDRLALASRDFLPHGGHFLPLERYRDGYRPSYKGNERPSPAAMPVIRNTAYSSSGASAPAQPRSR
ncbi:hypothetical protein [Rhodanobacter sp. DHB23]|uniref:hypothetical protein n=1 Tax=Rhodanobacter sp. DHB23 TaxID=2775923 RepID=UPI0017840D38|nr:hypothetical protein [Rhodanobacter sp. DHB23]MBD8872050.1 hypothetical protein [Rhodanobacter sp. DHB23]